jgi:hypothetical protein
MLYNIIVTCRYVINCVTQVSRITILWCPGPGMSPSRSGHSLAVSDIPEFVAAKYYCSLDPGLLITLESYKRKALNSRLHVALSQPLLNFFGPANHLYNDIMYHVFFFLLLLLLWSPAAAWCCVQVVSLSSGLDRCAALLKTLLSPDKQGPLHTCIHCTCARIIYHSVMVTLLHACTCMYMYMYVYQGLGLW